jgi:hypothetical protein
MPGGPCAGCAPWWQWASCRVPAPRAQGLGSTLIRLEREDVRATIQRDTAALHRLEAPEATFTYADASTGTADVTAVAEGRAGLESLRFDSLQVRSLAPKVGEVTGRARSAVSTRHRRRRSQPMSVVTTSSPMSGTNAAASGRLWPSSIPRSKGREG